MLALDMILREAQNLLVAFTHYRSSSPVKARSQPLNSFKISIVTVASKFRCWLLMYIATDYYFQSDSISHYFFADCLIVSFVLDIPRHSMDLVRCIDGFPRCERLRPLELAIYDESTNLHSKQFSKSALVWCILLDNTVELAHGQIRGCATPAGVESHVEALHHNARRWSVTRGTSLHSLRSAEHRGHVRRE